MNLKTPCTSCSDWQPSTMRVSIACFIALLIMLLLAKGKADVFRVWPFSLQVACSCRFLHWAWTIAVPSWSGEHPVPSTHKHTTDPHSHILTVTQICTPWRTHTHTRTYIHTQICIHWHRPTPNWTHIIIALSFSLSCSTMTLECTFFKPMWHL